MYDLAVMLDRDRRFALLGYFFTLMFVGGATIFGLLLRRHFAAPDFVMLYLLAIVASAARFGRNQALLASALSILGYDFFFVPPFHTLLVTDERHLLTFVTLFVVGLLI